jgi:predicted Zn-dependent peptidase
VQIPRPDGTASAIPEGTAHFLEHKLFESKELDAFDRFAKTGASANAHTGWTRTSYLFSASANVPENLEILLDFVLHPYFTQETVQKEQGIIGQEIRMYQDEPDWVVYFQFLELIYARHPVRIDIAGTQGSIARITAGLLYDCYHNFYAPGNMALTVAGNADPDAVLRVVDKVLSDAPPDAKGLITRARFVDSAPPATGERTRRMAVETPRFLFGFKEVPGDPLPMVRDVLCTYLILEILAGETSALYEELLGQGLVNALFDADFSYGDDYAHTAFGGESKDPRAVADRIRQTLRRAKREGIQADDFEAARRQLYGKYVMSFNSVNTIAERMSDAYFEGGSLLDRLQTLKTVTLQDVNARLQNLFRDGYQALSIIEPIQNAEAKP